MDAGCFDEVEFFAALARSGCRALLIGRRALIALGAPVITADYDVWIHIDDIEAFNRVASGFNLLRASDVEAIRARGCYVLEGDERIHVLVARAVPTIHGESVRFDEVRDRRELTAVTKGVRVAVPSIPEVSGHQGLLGARPVRRLDRRAGVCL